MKHITFGDKSLLIGDEAADALLHYGAFLATEARGDTVEIRAISSDGDEVMASFLMGPGVTIMAETASSQLPEPNNDVALEYMRHAQTRFAVSTAAPLDDDPSLASYDDTYELDFPGGQQTQGSDELLH